MTNNITAELTLHATGEVFVVPNKMSRLRYWMENDGSHVVKRVMRTASANNVEVDKETRLIELWIASKELDTTNLFDHGFTAVVEGTEVSVRPFCGSIMPACLFEGKKEGDIVNINIPVDADIMLNLDLTLNQTGSRYRRFGTFEEVFTRCS